MFKKLAKKLIYKKFFKKNIFLHIYQETDTRHKAYISGPSSRFFPYNTLFFAGQSEKSGIHGYIH